MLKHELEVSEERIACVTRSGKSAGEVIQQSESEYRLARPTRFLLLLCAKTCTCEVVYTSSNDVRAYKSMLWRVDQTIYLLDNHITGI